MYMYMYMYIYIYIYIYIGRLRRAARLHAHRHEVDQHDRAALRVADAPGPKLDYVMLYYVMIIACYGLV